MKRLLMIIHSVRKVRLLMSEKARTSDFFNAYAHDFDAIYGSGNTFFKRMINEIFRKSMKIRYEKTLAACEPIYGMSVIDIGCGPGHYSIALACKGAGFVQGMDFSQTMIDIAVQNAEKAGVADKCAFICNDFVDYSTLRQFDYAVVMGVMDYISEPVKFIERILSITKRKAFFSFPADGGVLAWQRKVRYRQRCDLYMYTLEQLKKLFEEKGGEVAYEKISRDYFVTVNMIKGQGERIV